MLQAMQEFFPTKGTKMVMEYLCCDPIPTDKDSVHSEDSITCSTDDGILECDYDTHVTKLYHNIEERQWEEVLYFLETGKWSNASIFSAFGEQEDTPQVQARTWVTALDEKGNVRWCQLPLHAAVTFLAPFAVIAKLIEIYPKSVRCADDQDMLPLHYAFRFGAEDDILVHLLEKFPQAVGKRAVKDRLPLDLAQYGPRPERGAMIEYYIQSAVRNAKTEWDREYEKMVTSVRKEADAELEQKLREKSLKLEETIDELNRTRRELQLLKREASLDRRESQIANMKSSASTRSARSAKSNSEKRTRSNSRRRQAGQESHPNTKLPSRAMSQDKKTEDAPSTRSGIGKIFGKLKI